MAPTKAAAKAAAPSAAAAAKQAKKKPNALTRRVRRVKRSGRKAKRTMRELRRRVRGGTTRRGDMVVTTGPLGLTSSTARVRRRTARRRRTAKPAMLGRPTFAEEMQALLDWVRDSVAELPRWFLRLLGRVAVWAGTRCRAMFFTHIAPRGKQVRIRLRILFRCPCRGTGRMPYYDADGDLVGTMDCPYHSASGGRRAKVLTFLGLLWWATCPCAGTGRITRYNHLRQPLGSVACERHGRDARGRAASGASAAARSTGLVGLAGWLAENHPSGRSKPSLAPRRLWQAAARAITRPDSDKIQARAARAAAATNKTRFTGPTAQCTNPRCEDGIVLKNYTNRLRASFIEEQLRLHAAANAKKRKINRTPPPSRKKLLAQAKRKHPHKLCEACRGLGRVKTRKSGGWHGAAELRPVHTPTRREKATGKTAKRPGRS